MSVYGLEWVGYLDPARQSIRFSGHDPGREVKADPALDFRRKRDCVVRIDAWCMSDGKDEERGLPVGFANGQGKHEGGPILLAFFPPPLVFIRPEISISDN